MFRLISFVVALVFFGTAVAQDIPLQVDDSIFATLSAEDKQIYSIHAESDNYILGRVNQISVDVELRILDPEGNPVSTIDSRTRGTEQFSFETEAEGQYTIEVSPKEEEHGDFSIVLERLEPVETDPSRLADQLMARYDRDDTPGGVISVFKDGQTLFSRAYGMANLSYDIPFQVDTVTNIGSTSKQFTAFAIMLLQEQGLLSLDDDIREHVPELPQFDEIVTVRHIITHTSGLREFLNLLSMSGRRLDHGDYIGRDEIIGIIQRQPALQNSPGSEWNYNNTAYALAALIVERISGQTFTEFMNNNVFGPIGMQDSLVRSSPEHIVKNNSAGYIPNPDGGYLEARDLGGAVGAGSIYTTVEDLQRWVENFRETRLGNSAIFEEMMTSYVLTDGEPTDYGYGLTIDEQGGLKRVHHGGADVAHRSMLAYFPEINAGITTQSNNAGFDGSIAFQLAEAFFGDAMVTELDEINEAGGPEFDRENYDPESFDELVGRYELDDVPDFIISFSRDGDTLYAEAAGQSQLEIVPTADLRFDLTSVDASLEFHRNEDGTVDSLTLNQGGEQHATRLNTELWEPTNGELSVFTGRYYSDEIETFYVMEMGEEQLTLSQRRLDDIELSPTEKDKFSGGQLSLSFERDRNDQVIGFYLSNGRTRGVRFALVSE